MRGARLLQSLTRTRSSCRSLLICVFSQNGIRVLSDWTPLNGIICHGKGMPSTSPSERASDCWFRLPHLRFYSVCSERLSLYDEGLDTCVQNQHDVQETSGDLHNDQENKTIRPHKSKRARQSQSSRLQGSELSSNKNLEGENMVQSRNYRAFKNGSYKNGSTEILVTELVNNGDETAHNHVRDRDDLPNSTSHCKTEDSKCSGGKVNYNQEQPIDQSIEDVSDLSMSKDVESFLDNNSEVKILDFSDMQQIFQVLCLPKQSGLQKHERDALAKVFRHFLEDGWASEQALHRYHISPVVFPMAVSRFRKFFFSRCTSDLKTHLLQLGPSTEADQFLFPLFWKFSSREFSGEIARYRALVETADLTKPHTWFPLARAMRRKVVYHAGPTNSGKTYNAIQRFKVASCGVYCGPLRLLAMEVYDSVNADGVYCSLITGQERKEVPFAKHVACTVEMVPTLTSWEVAVLDEIQMITDDYRGWAWTRAFLGVQAEELHVCGDPSALKLVRDLCAVTGDELEEHSYERFEPLSIDEQSLQGKFAHVQPGDCLVTFSRKEIFSIKRSVEFFTRNRCCVIYGALPPETRTHQAKLFNDPNSGYDVLVATDAVGMGLNLNIRRVIFYTLEKYTGDGVQKVSASQVKQIAGRAGRRGTIYHTGVATTFFSKDIQYLVDSMQEPFEEAHSAGLFPVFEQIELFASQLPEATFSKLLDHFAETCQVDGSFFLCRNDNLKKIASVIDKVKDLTLEDKMSFILAPVNCRDAKVVGALLSFALAYSKKLPVHLAMGAPTESARSVLQLMDLEARHQVLSLYLWLSQRFPEEYFPQKEQAEQMAADIALLLGESLVQTDIRTIQVRTADKKTLPSRRSSAVRTRRARSLHFTLR